jgi:predicted ATPase
MTIGFSRLRTSGYRRLRSVDLPLAPLNVLIGANGVGKSSVLDALDLLAAAADGSLENTISDAGGIASLVTQDGKTDAMALALQMQISDQHPIDYELRIGREGVGYAISREQLTQQQDSAAPKPFKFIDAQGSRVSYHDLNQRKLLRPNWDYKATETALSQVPKMYRMPERFRHTLASSSALYHTLDVSYRAPIRVPQRMQPATTPGSDGADLLSCLYVMRETDRDRFEVVVDTLHAAFRTFERIDFPPAAAGMLTLAWKDRDFSAPFHPHQLSEGTLRFLWLVTLLQSPGLPTVTLIDEPEVSLHPEMLRLLADLMREASSRTQLIVATHSDRFVRFLEPEELVVCDLTEDGGMTAQRASNLNLDTWLADYTLDEIWGMGRIGGRS